MDPSAAPQAMSRLEYPALLVATEAASAATQRAFFGSRASEFIALALAASLGPIPNADLAGAGPDAALIMFVLALVIRVSGVGDRAERRWYDARAASESIKSASWQFAVGGEAFGLSDETASVRFLQAQQDVLKALPNLDVPVDAASTAITPQMIALRQAPLAERTRQYGVQRVEDQRRWYAAKARLNGRRARQWRSLLVAVEADACLLGLFRALGSFDVDWLGLLGTAAAGIAAWKQTRNYGFLSESYSVTSHEVTLLAAALPAGEDEDVWAQAVHDAEAAFSREHTLWLARRQGPATESSPT